MFALPAETEELAEAARRFAAQRLAPDARQAEQDRRLPDDLVDVLVGFGLTEDGLPSIAAVVALEELAKGDAGGLLGIGEPSPIADQPAAPLRVADPDDESLPARAEWAPALVPTSHVWVSTGDDLALHEVANVEPVQSLAFAASAGVTCDIGREVFRATLAVGAGFDIRGRSRLRAAAIAVGIAQSSIDATITYTTERVVFGKPVAHHQGNAFELAALATHVHGARLVVRDAAARFDLGSASAGFWATQAFLTATSTAIAVTDAGIQLLGGHGFLVDHLAEKRFREARMLALLYGGRDAAERDLADQVLDVPDELFA